MAYENMTYEFILNRMMNRVTSQYPNLDNREGSIIFNAIASAAMELAIAYNEIDNALNESFVNTASREYMLIGCEQIGMDISIFEATYGVHKGEFNVEVPIGSRWNCELYNYEVTEYIGRSGDNYTYKMVCDTVGTAPNKQTGELTAITDNPDGLTYAMVTECLVEGENETTDDEIRKAYNDFVRGNATDGNLDQYKQWCNEYDGVGNSKIFPLWNGNNTVKVSILSASNRAASETLINEFQEYLDPNTTGMGDGVAPIGAFVTVTTATELPINVSANVKMKSGYFETTPISVALTKYFSDIAYEKSTIAYMNIGAVILSVEGVDSISDLKINNSTVDITLNDETIPVLGTVNWVVS